MPCGIVSSCYGFGWTPTFYRTQCRHQLVKTPNVVGQPSRLGRRHALQRRGPPKKVAIGRVQADGSTFFEKPRANPVNRFIKVRTVKLLCSTWPVHIQLSSGVIGRLKGYQSWALNRLTCAFSKKLANLEAAFAMFAAFYNYCWRTRRPGKSGKCRPTAAMMAGLADHTWSFDELFEAVLGG
jgi:hypothetical protein